MNASTFLFWPVVAMVVAGGLGAAVARNLIYAALSLGACLAGVAGLYLFLQAEYLAVVQMIVYVGGILILILFGVMFSRDVLGATTRPGRGTLVLAGSAGLVVATVAVKFALAVPRLADGGLSLVRSPVETWQGQVSSAPGAQHLGDLLLDGWLVPFLVAALLLTVVLVAALGLVRKDAT